MTFVGRFFLLVLVLGFVELYLLVHVAGQLGFLLTLALCVLTGVVGGSLVRLQGTQTLQQIQRSAAAGEVPATEIVSGLVLLIVGVLLIMPGFVTDVFGFALLVPPLRALAASGLVKHFEGKVSALGLDPSATRPRGGGKVIDVDFKED